MDEKSKNKSVPVYPIIFGVILLGAIIIGFIILNNSRKEQEKIMVEEKEKQLMEFQQKESERKHFEMIENVWKTSLEKATELAKNDKFEESVAELEKAKSDLVDSKYVQKAEDEIKTVIALKERKIEEALKKITSDTKELAKSKKYDKAIELCKDYSGPFARETQLKRDVLAADFQSELEKEQLSIEEKKQGEDEKNIATTKEKLSVALSKADIDAALAVIADSKAKDSLGDLPALLAKSSDMKNIVMDSYRADKNKNATVELKSGKKISGVIDEVLPDRTVRYKETIDKAVIKKTFSYDALSLNEILKRIKSSSLGEEEKSFLSAIECLKSGRNKDAIGFLKTSGEIGSLMIPKIPEEEAIPEIKPKAGEKPEKGNDPELKASDKVRIIEKSLEVKVDVNRKLKKGMDYDDKVRNFDMQTTIHNSSCFDVEDHTITSIVIGRSAVDKNAYTIAEISNNDFNLKSQKTYESEVTEITFKYDKENSYRYGYDYFGYFIVIRDNEGKILKTSTSRTAMEKIVDKLLKMKKETKFDKDGKILKDGPD